MSHTPGPWEVGQLDKAGQRIVRGEHIEICTCWHHGVMSIEKEMEANAKLIAAAPEMLEALITTTAEIQRLHMLHGATYAEKIGEPDLQIAAQASAVITKATA